MSIKGRVALTGRPGVGKTTLIEGLVGALSLSVGGMLTREIRKCGHRVGFSVIDLATGEEAVLAHTQHRNGPMVGRYTVDIGELERVGVAAIHRAVSEKDLVVIDEIAPMELCSAAFAPAVEAALASQRSLIISTHAHADHPLAHRVRQELHLFRVKLGNRDRLLDEIVRWFDGKSASAH